MTMVVLWHVHEMPNGDEDAKLIGIYSTEQKAEQAIERLRVQPGFRDFPDSFEVSDYELDKDHWSEGFDPAAELTE
jgi:hypothetical protein